MESLAWERERERIRLTFHSHDAPAIIIRWRGRHATLHLVERERKKKDVNIGFLFCLDYYHPVVGFRMEVFGLELHACMCVRGGGIS